MKSKVALAAFVLASSCAAPAPAPTPSGPAHELAGRTAGAPRRCVLIQSDQALRVSETDNRILLYGAGRTVWANRMQSACSLRHGDTLIARPIGSYHCRGDVVRSIDNITRIPGPSCLLGDFIPYGL